jgi:hypothetical protein
MRPTRLFVDARSTEEWRTRDFFPVLDPLLLYMLALGRAHPFAEGERLPAEVGLDIDRKLTCPAAGEFDGYAREHPLGGMPYGMAPLRDEDLRILASWVAQGTPPPPATAIPARAQSEVARWERFLNGDSLKQRIRAILRTLVPGPPALRGLPERALLRGGSLAHGARRGHRRDRHGAPV